MDVEADKVQKKALFYSLSITFVLIIGLIIAVVVLANFRNSDSSQESKTLGAYTDQSMSIYEDAVTEILDNTENSDDVNSAIAAYRVYIEKVSDGGAKALLSTDYYMILISLDTSLSMKDEVLNGLIAADNTIKDVGSALTVADAARYYQDSEISDRYQDIAKKRMEETK